MNKQELIEEIEDLKDLNQLFGNNPGYIKIDTVMGLVSKLDEPQKVKIPKFVAECIEYAQASDWDLEDVFLNIANKPDTSEISEWFYTQGNMDVIALAWLDGYEIEQEKRYAIGFKNIRKETNYLKYDRVVKNWYLGAKEFSKERKTYHTKKELESSGFDWVFNCPGVEIEEVEE